MASEDQEKTSFITPYGAFCYASMPFGLENAGATYQWCIQNCLHDQIGRNVHAYVDDIVVKSKTKADLIADLTETFNNLRRYNMRLNPEKMRLRGTSQKTSRLHRLAEGNQSQPGQDQSYRSFEEAGEPQGRPATDRVHGCSESLHHAAWREGAPIVSTPQEVGQVRLE